MSEAQGQGQATPETADSGAGESPEQQTTSQEERTFSQKDLNKIAAREKREGAKSRESELLEGWSEYGIESLEDVGHILDAQRTIETELEGEQVTEMKKAHKAALKEVQSKVEKYEAALTATLENEREGVPEHITKLLDQMDPADQLAYLAENREAIRGPSEESAVPASIGAGSSPGAANNRAEKDPATEHANWLLDAFTR